MIRDLIREFDDEKGFYESVYDWYYTTVATSFKYEVEEYCKVVIFGDEYAMSVQELYTYDRHVAVELWRDYVSKSLEEDFHVWVERCIIDEIDEFTKEFQQWLASQDDERVSDVIVALMSGNIDVTEIVTDWLYDRLSTEDWNYPA